MAISVVDVPKEKKKWEPKQWRPEYDIIIAYRVRGVSNEDIAKKMGFTKEFVSLIANLPKGKERYEQLCNLIKQKMEGSIVEDLEYIAKKTAQRLREVVDDDEMFKKSPFAIIDRGMDAIKGLGYLKTSGGNSGTQIGTLVITKDQKSDLLEGLDKLQQIKEIHGK
jgi:hypothetical protein